MISEEALRRTVAGIADTVASIEAGALESTPVQHAFLAGSLEALVLVLDDPPAHDLDAK